MLSTSLSQFELNRYVSVQVNNLIPDGGSDVFLKSCIRVMPKVLLRTELCFSKIVSRYYSDRSGTPFFNHLNSDHYCMFLYMLSHELFKLGEEASAAKVFMLNKMMFGVDAFYSIDLPEVFMFVHPLGTILGNASYSNYIVIYQGVTIGSLTDGQYPTFSERTILYSNSSIIGSCKLGTDCIVGARSYIIDTNLEDNQVVLGSYPNNKIIENKKDLIDHYFKFT